MAPNEIEAPSDVFIVDDDPSLSRLFRFWLKSNGYRAREFHDGVSFLKALREQGHPRLVLLDLMMPHMDGFEVLRYLEEHAIDVPVVVLSAWNVPETRLKVHKFGVIDCVSKPFSLDSLLETVRRILSGQTPPAETPSPPPGG